MSIPPRWRKCPRKGEIIQGIFLPFKTPLDRKYFNQLAPTEYFTPEMLINSQKSDKVKISLWFDLTNTDRYYDKETIKRNDITYFKLEMRGHKKPPTEDQTKLFIKFCNKFVPKDQSEDQSKSPLSIIAIHCTHGFNRTGFLICSYLVEQLDWSIDAALREFSIRRPPGIYKDDYIKELFRRYDKIENAPLAPARPEWCFENEEDDNLDDDGNQVNNFNDDQFETSISHVLSQKSQFMQGIEGVEFVSDPKKSFELQEKIKNLSKFKLKGFPGSQPVSMSHSNLGLLHKHAYQVSWKADGTRYMMLIEGENEVFLFDRDNSVFKIVEKCPRFPRLKNPNEHITNTLLDGEMVIDVVNKINFPRYLIYDIVYFEDKDVGDTDFNNRTGCINKEIIWPRKEAKQKGRIDDSQELFGIRKKDFWPLDQTFKILGEKFLKSLAHEADGLIFQPIDQPYKTGKCENILKWKPHTLNSIDFKIRIERVQNQGCLPETWTVLLVGRTNQIFGRIKATKEFRENDNKIVECTFDYKNRTWKFLRVRTDKSYPNAYETAVSVWETIRNPVTKEQLLSFIENYRFGIQVNRGQKRPREY